MIHALKIRHEYFEDVIAARKSYEIRKDDRPFAIGDFLALNEITDDGQYTGRCCMMRIVYITREAEFTKQGYAVLGIRPTDMGPAQPPMDRVRWEYPRPRVCGRSDGHDDHGNTCGD